MTAKEVQDRFDILEGVGICAALEQLAEEAAELTQSTLKISRILREENPTPVTLTDALESLKEETNDVLLCLSVIRAAFGELSDDSAMNRKLRRWKRRIKESREAER